MKSIERKEKIRAKITNNKVKDLSTLTCLAEQMGKYLGIKLNEVDVCEFHILQLECDIKSIIRRQDQLMKLIEIKGNVLVVDAPLVNYLQEYHELSEKLKEVKLNKDAYEAMLDIDFYVDLKDFDNIS
jgi:hypothetical protein